MPATAQYRLALIGIGNIAEAIAIAVSGLPNAKIVAGSCRSKDKGEKFAAKHGCAWYADYLAMLDREKPDVVVVCTPSGAHLEPALACIQRKIPVLMEKPVEITVDRVNQVLQAARNSTSIVGAIFPLRFHPLMQAIHQTAASGRFGSLSVVTAQTPWWREDSYYGGSSWRGTAAMDGGGAMMNQCIHQVDLVQWIAGATMPELPPRENPVEEVFCLTAKRGHDPKLIEVEDTAVAVLKFKNGALGQLLGATSMYPGSLRQLQIGGRDGTVQIVEDQLQTFAFRTARPEDDEVRKTYGGQTHHAGGSSDPMRFDYSHHTRNIGQFLAALDDGHGEPVPAWEAGKSVAIVEACYESMRTGKPVRPRELG